MSNEQKVSKTPKAPKVKFFDGVKAEFKKIIWPTFPAVVRNTLVTLGMCAFVGVIVALIDLGLSALVNLMLSL